MWPFSRKKQEETLKLPTRKPRKAIRRLIVGFIIGGAISSIVGKGLLRERRKSHLGEDHME